MVHLTLALGAFLHVGQVFIDGLLLTGRGELCDELALRSQHHESDTEDGVGTGGEDGEAVDGGQTAVHTGGHFKKHLCAFRAAYPVALGLLDGVAPVDGVETVEQALGIGRHAQTPLAHLLLLHGITAALRDSVDDLVVGQHGAQCGTPVDHRLGQVGDAVVHEHLLLLLLREGSPVGSGEVQLLGAVGSAVLRAHELEVLNELDDGLCLVTGGAEVGTEHALEGPLRPLVVLRVAGAHLAVPVEGEAYLVELLAIAVDVLLGGDGGVLSGLYGILLGGQSVGIVAHGVEHVEALEPLVAGIDVGCNISQWMAYMKAGSAGIREHVEHVELFFLFVFNHAIGSVLHPSALPFLLDFSEVVFHNIVWILYINLVQRYERFQKNN